MHRPRHFRSAFSSAAVNACRPKSDGFLVSNRGQRHATTRWSTLRCAAQVEEWRSFFLLTPGCFCFFARLVLPARQTV